MSDISNISDAMQPVGDPASPQAEITDKHAIAIDFLKAYYSERLSELQILYPKEKILKIRYTDIIAYNALREHLETILITHPALAISILTVAAKELLMKGGILPDIIIHITNFEIKTRIRDLREPHIGCLISVEGIVKKISEVRPRVQIAQYRCTRNHEFSVSQRYGQLKPPDSCIIDGCMAKKFELLQQRSTYIDSQRIRLQESPEGLRGGQQPQDIEVDLKKELCGLLTPGQRICLNGIVRTHPKWMKGGESSTFDIYLEGHSIEVSESEYDQIKLTAEDEQQILELSKDPLIHVKIAASIAPSIYGYIDLKMAFAFELFGGIALTLPDGVYLRGDIHVLLVGDPGIAKSQMMRFISLIAPRSVYTSGQSSSKAGLTVSAVRDPDGRWTLEAGALVLADMGICIVDEIDKMEKDDRDALHEAMEQQTISVAKAGITATLHSRCALLAAANPKYGRFDSSLSLGEQVNLPPSLLSRFDLIFVLPDVPNSDDDRKIAQHITMNRTGKRPESIDHIDPGLLKKYIAMGKQIRPILTDTAMNLIEDYYVSLRSKARESRNSAVPVTARQIEGIIRLAEASARIRLSEQVTEDDARRAIQMADSCLKLVAYDAKTHTWDIDSIATGKKKSDRDMERTILQNYRDLGKENLKISREDLISHVVSLTHWDPGTVTTRLEMMVRSGVFYEPNGTYLREV